MRIKNGWRVDVMGSGNGCLDKCREIKELGLDCYGGKWLVGGFVCEIVGSSFIGGKCYCQRCFRLAKIEFKRRYR